MTKYTAVDFANARFAEHPDGGAGSHRRHDGWVLGSEARHSDADMARAGWVPVPTKPTLTKSEFDKAVESATIAPFVIAPNAFASALGIEVIPDPEPTDEQLLAGIIRNIDDWQSITSPELLAKYLNTAGVTPPKEDN